MEGKETDVDYGYIWTNHLWELYGHQLYFKKSIMGIIQTGYDYGWNIILPYTLFQ